jgi:membrane-bound lytic murein transglycosylase B
MSVRTRWGRRLFAAALITAVPISMGSLAPVLMKTSSPADLRSADTSAVLSSSSGVDGPAPQAVAARTTISGGLALTTKAERQREIAVSSSKGSRVWTASALSDHDLPSAALRAYRHAARSIASTSSCSISWTLLAGIGRVESDHGRYGGSVLGRDGVPRPAIVGVALNGAGPVAAIRDTDRGRFDGDRTWDRAVGPMQFIPSTWQGAGRDGDGDGTKSPNDIDDAALAAAAYLCHTSGHLRDAGGQHAAIFSYNPSDYYVDLVMAFERGYRTGSFVIPSPPVPAAADSANSGDETPRAAQDKSRAKAKNAAKARKVAQAEARRQAQVRARQVAKAKAAKKAAHKPASKPQVTQPPAPRPKPKPTPTRPAPTKPAPPKPAPPRPTPPKPSPAAPKLLTTQGTVLKVGGGWRIGSVNLTPGDLGPIGRQDYDKNGSVGSVAEELDGLAAAGAGAVLTFYAQPTFKVNGFSAT